MALPSDIFLSFLNTRAPCSIVNPHQLLWWVSRVHNTYRFNYYIGGGLREFEPELVANAVTVKISLDACKIHQIRHRQTERLYH